MSYFQPTSSAEVVSEGLLGTLKTLWDFLLSSSALREGAKLFLIGGILEIARRIIGMAWTIFVEQFFIAAEFEDRDETFTWMMFWLSRQPNWKKLRSVRVTTSRYGQSGISDEVPGDEEDDKKVQTRQLAYVPSHNKSLKMWYNKTWMSVTLIQTQGDMWNRRGDERLKITLFTRKISKLNTLLSKAKEEYKKHSEGRISIYVSNANNDWSLVGSRPKRPLSSVILDKGVKERLLADVKDFIASEKWYADRGIPWRRGYLLHGAPGSGKTSLIHSLAGELRLDIYVISLSKKSLDDTTLNEMISKLPANALALMEDIDCATVHRGLNRDGEAAGAPLMPGQPPGEPSAQDGSRAGLASMQSINSVTLSGLLGAIDGVAAQEGRILFATTNKYSALDPALVRPGRLDVHIRFDNATKQQAAELFRCFFPPKLDDGEDDAVIGETADERFFDDPPILDGQDDLVVGESADGRFFDDSTTLVEPSVGSAMRTSRPAEGLLNSESPYSERMDATSQTVVSGPEDPCLRRSAAQHLAHEFAMKIPEGEFSMAALQGLLMRYKTSPRRVIHEVEAWIIAERRNRMEREGKIVQTANEEEATLSTILENEEDNEEGTFPVVRDKEEEDVTLPVVVDNVGDEGKGIVPAVLGNGEGEGDATLPVVRGSEKEASRPVLVDSEEAVDSAQEGKFTELPSKKPVKIVPKPEPLPFPPWALGTW